MYDRPPHLTDLAAELRRRAGAELLDELEITEVETERGRLRHRSLPQVWEQVMHRGDRVTATTRMGLVRGTVDYVGTDYATVVGDDTSWDIRLERSILSQVERSTAGGHTVTGGSRTFKARLAEYEATGEPITILLPHLAMRGRIAVVATDHVVVTAETDTATVPIQLIDVIRRDL